MSSTFEKGSPVRGPEVSKRVSYIQYIQRNTKERVTFISRYVSLWKKGSLNFLTWVYIAPLRSRPLSLLSGNSSCLRIKLSCIHLKSDSHPKTLNLWSITPYKNTIKCLWMPFFIHFAINMKKKSILLCKWEKQRSFWCLTAGEVSFFCTNYRNSLNEKSFFLHTSVTTNTVNSTDLERNGGYRNASWVYKNEHMETLATNSLLFRCLDASLCPQHDFVTSKSRCVLNCFTVCWHISIGTLHWHSGHCVQPLQEAPSCFIYLR